MTTNEDKAKLYDQLLKEYDVKAREVSVLKGEFELTRADELRMRELKIEMDAIQKKAMNLGSL
jgi:hypothetical protein|tara:strand:- start:77 stop:265 length:189 start_codon:yes stop_codon:yes gene_type:complete